MYVKPTYELVMIAHHCFYFFLFERHILLKHKTKHPMGEPVTRENYFVLTWRSILCCVFWNYLFWMMRLLYSIWIWGNQNATLDNRVLKTRNQIILHIYWYQITSIHMIIRSFDNIKTVALLSSGNALDSKVPETDNGGAPSQL